MKPTLLAVMPIVGIRLFLRPMRLLENLKIDIIDNNMNLLVKHFGPLRSK
jgi:hypothetical protein